MLTVGIIWTILVIVIAKNELSSSNITLGIRFVSDTDQEHIFLWGLESLLLPDIKILYAFTLYNMQDIW